MAPLIRDLVFVALEFLREQKLMGTVHKLEQESGLFFDFTYLEELGRGGDWDEAEKYLLGFTKVDDNLYSRKIFYEIRKQKYLEALDKDDRKKAVDILVKDLKVFSTVNEDLYMGLTELITLKNFRECEDLSHYKDTMWSRNVTLDELEILIDKNPLFQNKLQSPSLRKSRLRTLIDQRYESKHLVFIVMQFLQEEKFEDSGHKLEQESGLYFNINYIKGLVLGGEWDEAEKYLSGFINVDDNLNSRKIFFEIRKQKYLEALDEGNQTKVADIILKDLKVFSTTDEELYKRLTQLVTLENFRECAELSSYTDAMWGRKLTIDELQRLIASNPLLRDKLQFPSFRSYTLRTLFSQRYDQCVISRRE